MTGVSHGFICPQCEAHFLYDEFFVEHIREHHGETINDMSNGNVLLNSFPSSDRLGKENNSPVGKSLKCDDCSYTCTEKSDLVKHLRFHLYPGKKPYKCKECSYSSTRKGHLTLHLRTHTGEKPYKCSQCLYSSTRKGDLTSHI